MMTRDEAQRVIDLEGGTPTASVTVAACRAVVQLTEELEQLRAQVADVGWAGDWFNLDGERVRWLRVHGATEHPTWHLIDEGAIAPQASIYRSSPGRWLGRKPHGGALCRPTAAAACEALYPGLTPPAGCEP